ncbi:TPA: hypothetical protein EYQ19_00505 [Candidatus Pacearchaeota archaeon]|nr:hypothetical protein [Candidatus Pacearchaeota archaeon]
MKRGLFLFVFIAIFLIGLSSGQTYKIIDLDTPRSCNVDGSASSTGITCTGVYDPNGIGTDEDDTSATIDSCVDSPYSLVVGGTTENIILTKIGNNQLQVTCEIIGGEFDGSANPFDILDVYAQLYYKKPGFNWELEQTIFAESLPILANELYSLDFTPFAIEDIPVPGEHYVRCVYALHNDEGTAIPGADSCSDNRIDVDDMAFSVGLCDEDQTIFSISDTTNAHGELWNGAGNYPYRICYDALFGLEYTEEDPLVDPRGCTGANLVLKLSDITNAHAENPFTGTPTYSTNVCFGDLACEIHETNDCANSGKTAIASLSADTNAHLGLPDSYGKTICCSSQAAIPVEDFGWYDFSSQDGILLDSEISTSNIGNDVQLKASGLTLPEGDPVTFEVWEKDVVSSDDKIRTVSSGNAFSTTVDVNGNAVVEWTITEQDYVAATSGEVEFDTVEFYFKVITSSNTYESTGIDSNEDAYDNHDPIDGILEVDGSIILPTSPPSPTIAGELEHRGVYFSDILINFDHTINNPGGSITYTWIVEQNLETDSDFDSLNPTTEDQQLPFDLSFTSTGERVITLRATNSAGLSSETQIAILIIDLATSGMITFIETPAHHEVLSSDICQFISSGADQASCNGDKVTCEGTSCAGIWSPNGPYLIDFSAADSFVLDVSFVDVISCPTINCVGGDCAFPTTENDPEGVIDGPCPIGNSPQPYNSMIFDWTFTDVDSVSSSGDGMTTPFQTYTSSEARNDKISRLMITDPTGPIETFERRFTLGQCISGGSRFLDISTDNSGIERITELGTFDGLQDYSANACKGPDGLLGGGDDCCPINSICTESDGCVIEAPEQLQGCNYYTDLGEVACSNYEQNKLESDPLYGELGCGQMCGLSPAQNGIDCGCIWIESTGLCSITDTTIPADNCQGPECPIGATCDEEPNPSGCSGCGYSNYQYTECINGFQDITVTATLADSSSGTWTDSLDVSCTSGTEGDSCSCTDQGIVSTCNSQTWLAVPCGQFNIELPFFGYQQFLSSLGIIFLIYLFLYRKEEN